jgi:predicted YcjX-like family ATPase
VAIDGLNHMRPAQPPPAPSASDIELALRYGSVTQRNRLLAAIRQLSLVVDDVHAGL